MATSKWKPLKALAFCCCFILVSATTSATGSTKSETVTVANIRTILANIVDANIQHFNTALENADGVEVCTLLKVTDTDNLGILLLQQFCDQECRAMVQNFCDSVLEYDVQELMEAYSIKLSNGEAEGEITFFPDTLSFSSSQDAKVDIQSGKIFYEPLSEDFQGPRKLTADATMGLDLIGFQLDYHMDIVVQTDLRKPLKGRGKAHFFVKNPLATMKLNLVMNEELVRIDTTDFLFKFEPGKLAFHFTGLEYDGEIYSLGLFSDTFLILNQLFQTTKTADNVSFEDSLRKYISLDSSTASNAEMIVYSKFLSEANLLLSHGKSSLHSLIRQLRRFGKFEYSQEEAEPNQGDEPHLRELDDQKVLASVKAVAESFANKMNTRIRAFDGVTVCTEFLDYFDFCGDPKSLMMDRMELHELAETFGATLSKLVQGRIALLKSSARISLSSHLEDVPTVTLVKEDLAFFSEMNFLVPLLQITVEYEMEVGVWNYDFVTAKGELTFEFIDTRIIQLDYMRPAIFAPTVTQRKAIIGDMQLRFGGLKENPMEIDISEALNDAILDCADCVSLKEKLIFMMETEIVRILDNTFKRNRS